ncbi:SDR family NAD(P)-dependent oxidoreductase [Patulibacter minatonensis]|uniref:SDR family NAD(P)-dependent oxidoreductase n=1 Tax=Patulibacter minatonensis TaxID=298163 RepID=UPI000479F164|nr:SDR family NAD(P)-dependent oxidoreductase [Patulibacter minatonensis]
MSTSDRPTAVVTGANRGIGRAVAEQLLVAGHRVVLAVRDRGSGAAACHELGLDPDRDLVVADLSTIAGANAAADAILDACPSIDALVQNAGIWPTERVITGDGLEQAFAVNHVAPFVLNHRLADRLAEGGGARVVQVSAGLYIKGTVDLERTPTGEDFSEMGTYCDTKLANLLLVPRFAQHWAGTGVTITALHPGVVRTGLGDREGPEGDQVRRMKESWASPDEGARPVVRLVVDPELDGVSGRYWFEHLEQPLIAPATDTALAAAVWDHAGRIALQRA